MVTIKEMMEVKKEEKVERKLYDIIKAFKKAGYNFFEEFKDPNDFKILLDEYMASKGIKPSKENKLL